MKSLTPIDSVLDAFLARKAPGVLAIKGRWGVGKTYLWNRFMTLPRTVPGCTAYSYVSLFGINSIADLKRAIFTGQKPLDGKNYKRWWARFKSGAVRHLDLDVNLGPIPMVALKNTELWADTLEDRALRNFVVCLDDLERKEDSLSTSALLGFIASLRDTRGCKVVLLYNEAKAEERNDVAPHLREYREKVIDQEVLLNPTAAECYSLVFADGRFQVPLGAHQQSNPFAMAESRDLPELFDAIGVTNIRVLQKIRVALEYFEPVFKTDYPRQWPLLIRQIAKICCLHYLHAHEFEIEDVTDHQRWLAIYGRRKEDGAEASEFNRKYSAVEKTGYHTQPTDSLIVEYLRHGYLAWDDNRAALKKLENEQKSLELGMKSRANWNLLWHNFRASQQEFIDTQMAFLRAHHQEMGLSGVSELAVFLRQFGPDPEAEALLDSAIEAAAQELKDRSPMELDLYNIDPESVRRVRARIQAMEQVLPIEDAIMLLTGSNGYNSSDLRSLTGRSAADFLEWLKISQAVRLPARLKTFRERFTGDTTGGPIVQRLDEALREIAKRSAIDRIRVERGTGLKLPPEAPSMPPA